MIAAFVRCLILYVSVVIAMRLMGKRQLGELEPNEFAVTIMISELATVPIQDTGIPLLHGIIPILVIVSFEFILTFVTMKSYHLRGILCGKPSILVQDGIIDMNELKRSRMTLGELQSCLRQKSISDIQTVRYAIMEPGGQLSVILFHSESPVTPKDIKLNVKENGVPITLVSDGRFIEENLKLMDVNKAWVERWLREHGKKPAAEIFLMTLDDKGVVYAVSKDECKHQHKKG